MAGGAYIVSVDWTKMSQDNKSFPNQIITGTLPGQQECPSDDASYLEQ